ncbi:MAG: NAD-dependent epimerase/dehydratase family protein [Nannocystaceae bacterium]
MRTLVTGSGGQVGLDLIAALRAEGHEVHASDVRSRPDDGPDARDVPWHMLDVCDPEAVRELVARVRPDRIFHLAAILSARGESMPDVTYQVNQGGLYNVLEAARLEQISQVMFTSTIAVFGPGLPPSVADDVPLQPTTMYGVTKASGEMLGAYYSRRFGIDFRAVRYPGLISASVPGGGTSDYALFMYVDGVRRGHYTAFCRPDTTIPLMYMPDGLRALLELSNAPRSSLTRCVYNVAAFSPTASRIAEAVMAALPGATIDFDPDPIRQAILDSWPDLLIDDAARRDWNWKPEFDLDGMTDDLIPRLRTMLANEDESTSVSPQP